MALPSRLTLSLSLVLLASCATTQGSNQDSIEDVFNRVQTSVVTIRTTSRAGAVTAQGTLASADGIGSGVLVSDDGQVLTAAHVVQTADAVAVMFPTGEVLLADIVASEPNSDVALLQLQGTPPSSAFVAPIGDSDMTTVASPAFVVGAPLGYSHTLTVGHISARRPAPPDHRGMVQAELFQTDAAINQGNSGGPLFNMRGEVIGIVSHIISMSGGSEGLGFAVTSNVAKEILFGDAAYWSGLDGTVLTGELAKIMNIPPGKDGHAGFLVEHVALGSPAEKLGVQPGWIVGSIGGEEMILGGDVILTVMGASVGQPNSRDEIAKRLSKAGGMEALELEVLRAGQRIKLSMKKN
jgi:serine protease Do